MDDGKVNCITVRNFLGSLVGGTLGVVLFAWSPLAAPVGLLIGCLLGFWYREVPGIISSSYRTCYGFALGAWHQHLLSIINVPDYRFVRWLRQDSLNAANAIRIGVILAHACPLVIVFIILAWFQIGLAAAEKDLTFSEFLLSLGSMLGCLAVVMVFGVMNMLFAFPGWGDKEGENPLKQKRRLALCSSKYGLVLCALKDVWLLFKIDLCILAVILCGCLWLSIWCLPIVLFFGVIIATPVLALRGLTRLVTRIEHWLCVSVTLVVTATSIWFVPPAELSSPALWLVALLTGSVAGLATEIVRRLLARFVVPARCFRWITATSLQSAWDKTCDRCGFILFTLVRS